VDDFGKRNGAASRDEVRTPLEDEAGVPESENGEKGNRSGEGGALGAEELRGAIEENGEAENEERSERNEKTVAVRRDAGPVRIAGDEKIKSKESSNKRSARTALPAPENEKTGDGKKKDGRPNDESVIGREKDREKVGRKPVPPAEWNVSRFERITVNDVAGDESRKQAQEENGREERVAKEKFGNAESGMGSGSRGRAKGEIILAGDFDGENGEDHGVGVVNIEHEAGDQSEKEPLDESARGARFVPIPKKKCHDEGGMCVGPRGIEIHVDG